MRTFRPFALLLMLVSMNAMAQTAGRQRIELGGTWSADLGECILPGTTDENRLGPGIKDRNVTFQLSRLYPYEGKVAYTRQIEIPSSWKGSRLALVMERTKPSTLWIDGDSIGHRSGLFGRHVYQLGPLKDGVHEIRILIDNSDTAVPKEVQGSHAWTNSTQTNWNGILGQFYIERLPDASIENVMVFAGISGHVRADVQMQSERSRKAILEAKAYDRNGHLVSQVSRKVSLDKGASQESLEMNITSPELWSEFDQPIYSVEVRLASGRQKDSYKARFGFRDFKVKDRQFEVNGFKAFMRGTHDGCVFPLTGYAPTDKESWARIFRIARQYGINHYRFHSYSPTQAAFEAADEAGIYIQTELPVWGAIKPGNEDLNRYLLAEADALIREFGNHPSFVMLALGNELTGDVALMWEWLDSFRKKDSRHLYCYGSNNFLGRKGAFDGEDYMVTCRVGEGENYSSNTRSSFSFADEDEGGLINATRPNTRADFSNAISACPRPVISHETCQFQIYPDYDEIGKYKGVLYPFNFEIFRDRLRPNGLSGQAKAFHRASGRFALECYKADMEYCFRTPGFGGFQLLDIKDYPGQGSALCGILDAFMDSKDIVAKETFRSFNSPLMLLALMDDHCWNSSDTLKADIAVANYTQGDYKGDILWTLRGEGFLRSGTIRTSATQGNVTRAGMISVPLDSVRKAVMLRLELMSGGYSNYYKVWVYPKDGNPDGKSDVYVTKVLDDEASRILSNGGKVLLCPALGSIAGQSVGGLFTCDYWNYAMFKTISENAGRPVSPGTLGFLMDDTHPLFVEFPTEGWSDFQWWSIARNSRPLVLDGTPEMFLPIVQSIDNVERNHKLGILMEMNVGKGKLMLCTTDLDAISKWPEGRQYRKAILDYMDSKDFVPGCTFEKDEVIRLLTRRIEDIDIQGQSNISDYGHDK